MPAISCFGSLHLRRLSSSTAAPAEPPPTSRPARYRSFSCLSLLLSLLLFSCLSALLVRPQGLGYEPLTPLSGFPQAAGSCHAFLFVNRITVSYGNTAFQQVASSLPFSCDWSVFLNVSTCLSFPFATVLSIHLSASQSAHLAVILSGHLSVFLSVHLPGS